MAYYEEEFEYIDNVQSVRLVEHNALGTALPAECSLLSVDRPNVIIEAVKKAEAFDAAVQRLPDSIGGRPVPETTYVSAVFVDGKSYLQKNAD